MGRNSNQKRILIVGSRETVVKPSYRGRLQMAAQSVNILQYTLPDMIVDAIYTFDGNFMTENGIRWPVPNVQDVLGDPQHFFHSLELVVNDDLHPDARLIGLLQLVDIYFRIRHPDLAKHFGR